MNAPKDWPNVPWAGGSTWRRFRYSLWISSLLLEVGSMIYQLWHWPPDTPWYFVLSSALIKSLIMVTLMSLLAYLTYMLAGLVTLAYTLNRNITGVLTACALGSIVGTGVVIFAILILRIGFGGP